MTAQPTLNDTGDAPAVDEELLQVLADPLRARLVSLLAREQLCTCHLAAATGALSTAVSNHLRRMRRAGLVDREAVGRYTYYRLRPEVLDRLGAQFRLLADAARETARRPCPPSRPLPGGPAMPTPDPSDAQQHERHLVSVTDDLARRFQGHFARETIDRVVLESYTALRRTAWNAQYLPLLAERFARERLTALAQAQGVLPREVPEVLFVCTHNAGRSQMAAALLTHRAQGAVHVRSAGTQPASEINPVVVEAMAELGLTLDQEFPKPLTDDVVRAADVVITMGCGDACPVYPGRRYYDWALADPAGRPLAEVRAVRDEIDRRVQDLIAELRPAASS
jgi:protein-tyrosine-phosphatase/DNA-binding transcriptional ArsR family regulator